MMDIFIGIHLFVMSLVVNQIHGTDFKSNKSTALLHLTGDCLTPKVRLDHFDLVELTSNDTLRKLEDIKTCSAHFMTGNTDQGICIHNNGRFFIHPDSGLELWVFTSRLGPDKILNHKHDNFSSWCTHDSLVSIELRSSRHHGNRNHEYSFSFQVTNVSKDAIIKNYQMDSFKHCNVSHVLKSGEEIQIFGEEFLAPGGLPFSCSLILSTKSAEEYEELCLSVKEYIPANDCASRLTVSGFHSRFWPETQVLGCNDTESELPSGKEMCSNDKTLTLNLRHLTTSGSGLTFTMVVKAKKHPHSQMVSSEVSQLRWLVFVKRLTFFVAAFDSLAGLAAAILANMIRRPRSFWKNWAEAMNSTGTCQAAHYEETNPESCSHINEIS